MVRKLIEYGEYAIIKSQAGLNTKEFVSKDRLEKRTIFVASRKWWWGLEQ